MAGRIGFLTLAWLLLGASVAPCHAAGRTTDIAIVVGAGQAAARSLDATGLARIYYRKMLYWQDGSKIEPVNLPAATPLRSQFSQLALKMEPEEQESYWNQQYFQGVFPPYVLSSEEAVLRFVADTPGAIGYVSACAVDPRVAVLLYLPSGEAHERACADSGKR
jgi:ABC-type phosphate transport system substrate-binding protein